MDTSLEITGDFLIREHVRRRKEKIVEYVVGIQIYELCTVTERMEGYSRFLRWWDQEHGPKQA